MRVVEREAKKCLDPSRREACIIPTFNCKDRVDMTEEYCTSLPLNKHVYVFILHVCVYEIITYCCTAVGTSYNRLVETEVRSWLMITDEMKEVWRCTYCIYYH